MPQRSVFVPGIGELLLVKRRSNRYLRLSITPAGKVRVSLPTWAPYTAGIAFAKSRQQWIIDHQETVSIPPLKDGDHIGKAHKLFFYTAAGSDIRTRVKATTIEIHTGRQFDDPVVQVRVAAACERALRGEAEQLLAQRLRKQAQIHSFNFKSVRVRKLTSRWGSCSNAKSITLSYYLMQLPWHLIDYVILHELVHTEQLHHGRVFWQRFTDVLPQARDYQKEIRAYKPSLMTTLS